MRAFVVGNGESLNQTPLEKLNGEICFAVNRINLIYPKTEWRPTDYVRVENLDDLRIELWRDDVLEHLENPRVRKWLNPWFIKELRKAGYNRNWENLRTLQTCSHYTVDFDSYNAPFNWHLPIFCTFGSSVNVAVQIAAQEGYSPIYLVGCDMGEMNHFDKDYYTGYENSLRSNRIANLNTLYAHMIAKRNYKEIYNATIGGALEVYERVDFDSLFK